MPKQNPASIGHNSAIPADQLKSIIERIERLEEEKAALASDIRDVYSEAKSNGYDVTALRTIIKMRKQDASEREEHEQIVATYLATLGMLAGTPLADAAIKRDLGNVMSAG